MIKLKIEDIINALGVEPINLIDKNLEFEGICTDSRNINNYNIFAPIKGLRFDGHTYINDVIKKGVKVTLWDKNVKPYPSIMTFLVEDVRDALKKIARYYVDKINCKIVAITGSNGKTSIKDMCASILSVKYKVTKTYKNFNNELGICLSIFNANHDDEILVLEMGMDGIGDIDKLVEIARPDVAIISNIGSAHLEFLKTRENIAKAKLEILHGLNTGGLFIRPKGEILIPEYDIRTQTFGTVDSTIYLTEYKFDSKGISLSTNLIKDIHINSFGYAQVLNCLPSILVGIEFGLNEDEIRFGLQNVEFTERRNLLYECSSNLIFDDSYKSNPEGVKICFETMMYVDKYKIAVLGDMLELGDEEVRFHEGLADLAITYNIDKLYLYGDLSKYTYKRALELGLDAHYYENKNNIVDDLINENNAIILFKASNAMKINEVIEDYRCRITKE